MTPPDFDAVFRSLGLPTLPKGASSVATFLPLSGDTVSSAPRDEFHALDPALAGTLPKLHFASPDAARGDVDEPDLLPLQVLGEGGMGQVLLAHQTALNRHVAVKVLKPSVTTKAAAAALVQEARTAGGLEHPSVVPIYALARDAQGLPALVMKRVDGLSWRELIHTPDHPAWAKLLPSSKDRLAFHIEVLVQVCNAVAHAHQRNVLHRDVKPANVLLGELGEVYLADWGVAAPRTFGNKDGERVRLVGTPAYLAPEMVTGEASKMDERTDVYLLGATLHEVLTGSPPHDGTDLREVLQHAFLAPEPAFPLGTPPLLAAACKRALAQDPAKRFPSATALRDELKRFLQHRVSSALAQAAAERLSELELVPDEPSTPFDERRWNALVFECRFGFTQALKDTPDHDQARDGLRRCLEVAARREITRSSPVTARAFLSELERPPPDLVKAVEALEKNEAERTADVARLRRLTHELDPRVSTRQRALLMFGMAGVIALMVLFFAFGRGSADIERWYGGWFRVLPLAMTCLVYVVVSAVGHRALFSTRINRELMALIGVGTFGLLAHRIAGVLVGMSTEAALVEDSMFLFALAAYGGVIYHRGFFISASIFMLGATLCGFWPERALTFFGITSAAAIAVFALVFTVWKRK